MHKRIEVGEILLTDRASLIEGEAFRNVIVILWDRVEKGCGICNYSSPSVYKSTMATAQFGNVAIPQLIKLFFNKRKQFHCEAYLFGGASVGVDDIVGVENLKMAKKVLASYTVPIASESTGGKLLRRITFNTENGDCALIKLHHHKE